jgi:hypothetical protein
LPGAYSRKVTAFLETKRRLNIGRDLPSEAEPDSREENT